MQLFLFCDVYGFGAEAANDPETTVERLIQIDSYLTHVIDKLMRLVGSTPIHRSTFSDNIMMSVDVKSIPTFEEFRTFFSHFYASLGGLAAFSMSLGMPLRGCVTFGAVQTGPNLIVGIPVNKAAAFEKECSIPLIFIPEFTVKEIIDHYKVGFTGESLGLRLLDIPFSDGIVSAAPVIPRADQMIEFRAKTAEIRENLRGNTKTAKANLAWKSLIRLIDDIEGTINE